ncbi:energy transducer TonB [Tenacibaculum sp. IB213877]|uniref:energy transducer TonB n=1 Tax=Tenacibaculum sp. IB213877 TaxID=3097351 RepID=UPI002A5A4474|nr:energy transducer TonB [Tenacibaculum sp. IB213877]MDY0781359.1 energy transducer TonB [Tenacibaculum sp. IB213877]
MQILNTEHKRKSAVITAILLLLLLFGIFNFGMRYLDPPIEYGIAVNFGNSEVGSGEPVQNTQAATPVEENSSPKQEETPAETIKEEVVTEETTKDVPVVKNEEVVKKDPVKDPVKEPEVVKEESPKPSKEATDALNNLLKGNSSEGATKGEGNDNQSGVKGNENGDPDSPNYYGNSGSGSGGNYNLAGRKALTKPIEKPGCEEEGTVVVSIEVDQSGKVIAAKPGAKGTTNSAPCLFKAAKEAALKTKWNADAKAPSKQRGTIIYKFSLSK